MMDNESIKLVYFDENRHLRVEGELLAVGVNGRQVEVAEAGSWIDLPTGGEVVPLAGRLPLGYNPSSEAVETIDRVTAVAAILPMGATRALLPGYELEQKENLPLLGYTGVGYGENGFKVAAIETDEDLKWNPAYYNTRDLPRLIKSRIKEFPKNRILKQLAICAQDYHCLTAQNIFYQRWEAGIPVSPRCNARCLGCISKQAAECCPAPQSRIRFVPSSQEVAQLAVAHLEMAHEAIISFGQGCEGEPLMQKELLVGAVQEIRQKTPKGTLNLNSNGGIVAGVTQLVDAGLDAVRISLFSAVSKSYNWYHQPIGYTLNDVKDSLKYAAQNGVDTALNLLLYPGFTNRSIETEALLELIGETGVGQVQLRNLNIDPEIMLGKTNTKEDLLSIKEWLAKLQNCFPELRIGNYTQPKQK